MTLNLNAKRITINLYPTLPARQMKTFIAIAFVLIIASLGSALFFLMKDKGRSNRTVHALAMRVGLSITLFLIVLASYKMGWIHPTGIR